MTNDFITESSKRRMWGIRVNADTPHILDEMAEELGCLRIDGGGYLCGSTGEWFCLNRIYLHGTIENLAGFDLIVNTTGPDTPSGIYPVVIDVSGTTYACTAHVWESNGDTIGLVALNTDRPAIDHAFAKFTAHSARI